MKLCYEETKAVPTNNSHPENWDYFSASAIDLKVFPPDISLLKRCDLDLYISLDFIPWRIINGITYVIATNKSEKLLSYLQYQFQNNFILIRATKREIYRFIQLKFRYGILDAVRADLYHHAPLNSAFNLITTSHIQTLLLSIVITACFIILQPMRFLLGTILIANIIFFINSLFKTLLVVLGKRNASRRPPIKKASNKELPIYTILLPIYKEDCAILGLIRAIEKLDYPKEKLDVKLVIEQLDRKTIPFIKKLKLDGYFHIICVPLSSPKTKPKACSYALQFAKGKYVTIYDAEDRPSPDQLKKAIAALDSDKNIACVQAKLGSYNRNETPLTACFAIEYSMLFDFFLKGLQYLGVPIPLGGSSCHFERSKLLELRGWDPYNVAEDADIGFRLHLYGYRIKLIDSYTFEESPISLREWINQRTRWIKGHIQTSLVHSRNIKLSINKIGLAKTAGFYCFLFLPIVAYILQPLIFLVGLTYLFTRLLDHQHDQLWLFSYINICLWIAISYISVFIAKWTHKWKDLHWQMIFFPCYYLLHTIAAFKAIWQLFSDPYYWHKTSHDYYKRLKSRPRAF